jgi:hypothetical protein
LKEYYNNFRKDNPNATMTTNMGQQATEEKPMFTTRENHLTLLRLPQLLQNLGELRNHSEGSYECEEKRISDIYDEFESKPKHYVVVR